MNNREWEWLSAHERTLPDGSTLPPGYLLKSLAIKLRRRLWGGYADRGRRFVWNAFATTESDGPSLVARTYVEHAAIRQILSGVGRLRRACEFGCGYGRMTVVLQEIAEQVTGFEREHHLVETARRLMPGIAFVQVSDLALVDDHDPYDLAMSFTVLQHLTDADAQRTCARMRQLAPHGFLLLAEKTAPVAITAAHSDGRAFLSRHRSIATYTDFVKPFRLVATLPRPADPAGDDESPAGALMLFAAPGREYPRA